MSGVKPKRGDGVESRQLGEECMLHDGRNGSVHIINGTAAFVWGLCDGCHTVDDIVKAVVEGYDIPAGTDVHKDIDEILTDFRRQNVLHDSSEQRPREE